MDIIAHRPVGEAHVFVVQGDVTVQPVDAIVNAANETLAHGGGVAAAIVGAGGRVIQEESDQWVREHGPVGRGQAAVTTAGALQASHVIHVVGPRYQVGQDNEGMLRDATVAALEAGALRSMLDQWPSRPSRQAFSGTRAPRPPRCWRLPSSSGLLPTRARSKRYVWSDSMPPPPGTSPPGWPTLENPERLMDDGLRIDKNQVGPN